MTRKARLLIIDDELDLVPTGGGEPRRTLYEKLASDFALSFLERPAELHDALERRDFDAILMDFVLEEWGIDARDIINEIHDSVPVALISKSWSTNFGSLTSTIGSFPVARLFTWDDMVTPRAREMVMFWITSAIRSRYGNLAVGYGPNDPLRIVQFSDMQFNATNGKRYEIDTQVAVQTIQSNWADPPHFLALTGDIAEAGRPSEYDMARDWVATLRKRLGQDRYQIEVLSTPGNHDVCWPLALAQRIDVRDKILTHGDTFYPELARYAFSPFREFSRSVEPADRWSKSRHYWVSGTYRQAGLILFGLNSSENLDSWGMPTRTLVEATVAGLFDDIATLKRDAPDALVVGLMHHPLDQSDESVVNSTEFKRNIHDTIGSIILLTGHVHEDTSTLTQVGQRPGVLQIASSTFTLAATKRPEDSVRGFNLIELERKNDSVVGIEVQTFSIIGHQLKAVSSMRYKRAAGRLSAA